MVKSFMMVIVNKCALGLIFVLFALSACSPSKAPQDSRLKIAVAIAPEAWLAEQIGGNEVIVTTLVEPGVSPETFDQSPKNMAAIAAADLFFVSGFTFEHRLIDKMAKNSATRFIEPSATLPLRHFDAAEAHHHHDGSDHKEAKDDDLDPHFWFSIKHMTHHAKVMTEAMIAARPQQKANFSANLQKVLKELELLQQEATGLLAPYKGRAFLVFHPTYGYLAEEFGLTQVAIEAEGKEPAPKQLAAITEEAKEHKISTIIVQPQFPFSAASAVAEAIGGQVIVVDSLSADYPAMFRRLTETLSVSFKDTSEQAANE